MAEGVAVAAGGLAGPPLGPAGVPICVRDEVGTGWLGVSAARRTGPGPQALSSRSNPSAIKARFVCVRITYQGFGSQG
ncbi:MAG: hypothetical protein OHK0015_39380 [Chloroflexi bacterium OHK40]